MRPAQAALALIVLSMLLVSSFIPSGAEAVVIEDPDDMETYVGVRDVRATDDDDETEEEEEEEEEEEAEEPWYTDLLGSVKNFFGGILDVFVMFITAPFRAIAGIWEGWGSSLGNWYGPIVAFFVIIVILVMYRLYSEFDEFWDKNS